MSPSVVETGGLRPVKINGFHNEDDHASTDCKHSNGSLPSTTSSSRIIVDAIPPKEFEKLRRVLVASAKGFSIGAGIKGGLAVFAILSRLTRKQRQRKELAVTNGEAIVAAVKETLRYGLFLGTFAGTFVSMDELIGALGGHLQDSKVESLPGRGSCWAIHASDWFGDTTHELGHLYSHACCCVSVSVWDQEQAVWEILQASHLEAWRHIPHVPILLPNIQESLPSSYKSFLNKHGGKDAVILQGVKEIASGKPFTNLEAIEKYYKTIGVDVKLDPSMKVPCSIVHGNQSCGEHILSFLVEAYKRALPVYLPVYLIPALIVHRNGLLKRPNTILAKGLLGTARSSLFLSVYCASAWMWTCFLFRIFKRCNIPMVAMGTFPTGLALAIEKKSRRIEISLYCFARAIESFFTCLADAGYLPHSRRIKRADVVVFSLSTAIIMHCYAEERDVFRSKYLNVLDWVFGVPPPPCETPRCNPQGKGTTNMPAPAEYSLPGKIALD
ncbi:hypothetical protein Ahy_B03g065190 isoform B [Arachis hypogaea]|uniref:Transmembrane protein 135 N-terminal domain-containing protein n=1 Tax=Arachis hypogaea TaxID=3818 RepID=A0A445A0Z4_ARAHY|nr:hypothetical protein Ahy_B03g065190 isoform A [Arachis hypogaea]RYR20100.1 hypothetical protein Ahy_B03g065190 isoform B [Arachis hypogaea]